VIVGDPTSNGGEKRSENAKGPKRERANESGDGNGAAKKKKVASTSKHPLRQAGMKPGEGCFLCKSKDHIAKHCPTKSEKDRHKVRSCPLSECGHRRNMGCLSTHHKDGEIYFVSEKWEMVVWICLQMCLGCRMWGHTLKNCPSEFKSTDSKSCYNCGEPGHSLDKCPKPLKDGKLPVSRVSFCC
jgi:hypothetical protein